MKIKLTCIAMVFLWTVSCFAAGQEKTVTITTLVDFAPYCFKKKNAIDHLQETIPPGSDSSQLQGYSWDVVRESFHEMGYTIFLMITPWTRGMGYVQKGTADVIFPAIKTRKREEIFLYSNAVVDETNIVVYVSANSDVDMQKGLASLQGCRISQVRGWAYGKKWEADQGIIKDSTDTILQGFKMLDRKNVFGVVGYENAFDCKLKTEGIIDKYKKSPPIDHVADYLMGKKNHGPAVRIVSDFDAGKKKIMDNGKLETINTKWKWIDPS
ncbi:MAG: transporter substrate-binding domain-containing protein [Proteobacteria bacterium]|nr:transporter substrate-binding domain-containing protein [Pseudomonadota bacterium]MBU4131239.1 transporter substrate-binding domain-containing protein [Pseudomonadota bacterium]